MAVLRALRSRGRHDGPRISARRRGAARGPWAWRFRYRDGHCRKSRCARAVPHGGQVYRCRCHHRIEPAVWDDVQDDSGAQGVHGLRGALRRPARCEAGGGEGCGAREGVSETLWVDSSETKAPAALSVVAGLVPATSITLALCFNVRIGVGSIDWFRSPLPPNRTCGSPASGSPVGGLTREGTDGPRTWRLVQAQRLPLG